MRAVNGRMEFFYKAGSTVMSTRCLRCGYECEEVEVAAGNIEASRRAVEYRTADGSFCNAWAAACRCGRIFTVDRDQCIEILSLLDNAT